MAVARTRRSALGRSTMGFLGRAVLAPLVRPNQQARRRQFEELGAPRNHLVMLGDSITEQGIWDEWFAGIPVANRGIGGEQSADLRTRLDTAIDQPLGVFLLIGTNDLSVARPPGEIAANVEDLVEAIQDTAPGVPVVVQSVLPRSARFRDEIIELNRLFRELVERAADSVSYLDLWPALGTPDGALKPAFTQDRLHLNGAGYRAWVDVIRPYVTEITGGTTR